MTLQKISDRILADMDGNNGGNFGAIILDDQIVMIDSGMYHTLSSIIRFSLNDEYNLPITKLIFTHSHADHVFGAQAFEPISKIASHETHGRCKSSLNGDWTISAIKECAESVKDERPEFWKSVRDIRICLPDIVFNEELILGSDQSIIIKKVGGHTSGSSIIVVEPEHIVFIGDLIFHEIFPYAGDSSCNPDDWIAVLKKIIEDDYKHVIPGHGVLCSTKGVEEQYNLLQEIRDEVLSALAKGMKPEDFLNSELLPGSDWDGYENRAESTVQHWFAFYRKKG
jgi:glyoxylase-like metal-dependent hydrolase (beta-lactamase superfamily II)